MRPFDVHRRRTNWSCVLYGTRMADDAVHENVKPLLHLSSLLFLMIQFSTGTFVEYQSCWRWSANFNVCARKCKFSLFTSLIKLFIEICKNISRFSVGMKALSLQLRRAQQVRGAFIHERGYGVLHRWLHLVRSIGLKQHSMCTARCAPINFNLRRLDER